MARTLLPRDNPNRTIRTESGSQTNRPSESHKWYSKEYLASVWAKRPAKLLALFASVSIATLLIIVYAAAPESTSFNTPEFNANSTPKTNVRVDGNGHVVLNSQTNLGTDDGSIHLASSFHYYPGQVPNLTTANNFAKAFEIITSQTNKMGSFAGAMITANPKLIMAPYEKSVQYLTACCNNSDYPNSWYSHNAAGKVYLAGPGRYIMQPGTFYSASATVGGIQGSNWFDWQSKAAKKDVDAANSAAGSTAWNGVYYDSMGNSSWANQINPQTGQQYADGTAFADAVQGIADYTSGHYPTLKVIGNGLRLGQAGILNHVDIGLDESWLRGNEAGLTAYEPEISASGASWQNEEQMVIDGNKLGKGTWLTVNIQNDTAAGGKIGCSATAAQINAWRHYVVASYLIANRGHAWLEFVPCVSHANPADTILPWTEATNQIYAFHLGAPLEVKDVIASYKVGGVYQRHYTSGLVLVNPTSAVVNGVVLGGTYLTESGASVTSISVPANSGIILTK